MENEKELYRIHTGRSQDRNRKREQMGCMKQCGSFQITPKPGQRKDLLSLVVLVLVPVPVSVPVPFSVNTPLEFPCLLQAPCPLKFGTSIVSIYNCFHFRENKIY